MGSKKRRFSSARAFAAVDDLNRCHPAPAARPPLPYPFVFKFDWGGEGDTVFPVELPAGFERLIRLAREYERTAQKGFLIQELIPAGNRVLRVAIIGERLVSYWRTARPDGPFAVNLAGGGVADGQHRSGGDDDDK